MIGIMRITSRRRRAYPRRIAPAGLFLAALLALPAAWAAAAQTLSFELKLYGTDYNSPSVQLTNTSTGFPAGTPGIKQFKLGIGDTRFHYDSVFRQTPSAGVALSLQSPDRDGTGLESTNRRTDLVHYAATGLTPGRFARFKVDIDPDADPDGSGPLTIDTKAVDYRRILFDLNGTSGSADNAFVNVTYGNGRTLSGRLPDFRSNATGEYVFRRSLTLTSLESGAESAVPEPGGGLACGGALCVAAALGTRRRRRRKGVRRC